MHMIAVHNRGTDQWYFPGVYRHKEAAKQAAQDHEIRDASNRVFVISHRVHEETEYDGK